MVDHTVDLQDLYKKLDVDSLLMEHTGLSLQPAMGSALLIEGSLAFSAIGPDGTRIRDEYRIRIRATPDQTPQVWETERRISREFHKLSGDKLCLASPVELDMFMAGQPTLKDFVHRYVIPYLYGHSYFEKYERMPFGEHAHGRRGIQDSIRDLFGAPGSVAPEQFLRLASLPKRVANKQPCPCGEVHRLGKCHNRKVNQLRQAYGRRWFAREYLQTCKLIARN